MACTYKINSVELSEQQFHGLVKRALSVINEKKNNSPEQIHTAQVFNMISSLGITEINTETLKQIEELNDQLGREYQTDDDFVSVNENHEIVINTSLINEVNQEIQSVQEPSAEKIESVINDIMFGQANEITRFSADPIVANKFVNVIAYKKSLIKRLQKLLAQTIAAKSNFDSKSEDYAKLTRLEKEIEERLNGKGHKEQTFYVQGLIREVTDLNKEDNIDQLFSYLNSDIKRLQVLSERSDIPSIYEAREILRFFDAIHNTSTAGTEGNMNPIFDMAGLKTGDTQTIQKFKDLAYNVIQTFEEQIQLNEKKVLEEMIKKDPDLNKIFGDDQLKYENFFNSGGAKGLMMKDIHWFDAFMMDGTMGTFSDFGHIPQLSKKILEEGMRKFVAKESQWNERMNNMIPAVTKVLKDMGHGINILGKNVGASFDLFRQKYKNGDKTNRLIDRTSAEFVDQLRKMNSDFFSEIERARRASKSGSSHVIEENAYRTKNAWNKINRLIVDPRKIKSITSNLTEFGEFTSEFIDDGGLHEAELKRHLQSDNGYAEAIADQEERVRKYLAEKSRYAKDLLEKHGVATLADLDYEVANEFGRWQVENNPFLAAKHYENNTTPRFKGIVVYPKMTRFNNFIARRFTVESKVIDSKPTLVKNGKQTGYYDKNFETIEKNPTLYEFHKLASEILTESRKHLPLEQQREMAYNVIAGKSKSFADILADPNLALGRKFSEALRNIHDKAVSSFTVKVQSVDANNSLVDTITGQKQSEVSLQFVNTNGVEIKRNFNLQAIRFIQTLNDGYKRNYKNADDEYELKKSSKIPFSQLSSKSKSMIADMLHTSPTEANLRKVLDVKEDNMVYIGRVIERSVISNIVESETFNLPQALKLYMHGAMEYAGRNEVMPVISMIKSHYERILKPNQNNAGQAEKSVDPKGREWANSVYDRWYKKHVLGNLTSSVWGVIPTKLFAKLKERNHPDGQVGWQANYTLSSLRHDERIIHETLQEAIDAEFRLPEDKRSVETIKKLQSAQEQLGRNFAMSAVADRFMDLTRAVGLGLSLSGAWYNYQAGKIANFIAATSGQYFSENAHWKAESIILGSHLKMMSGGLVATENSKKTAMMVERFKIFQDSSDEVHKSSMNSAFKIPSIMNIYVLQQRTEYVNQAPVLIAMMIDKKISAEEKPDISLWDALDENGKLIKGYDTAENKTTWELTEGNTASDFITHVSAAISNIHGDYSSLGGSVYSNNQGFRVGMMFKRWMSRYIHTRLASEYYDHSMGRNMKGRYKSVSAASGTAILGTMAVVLTGFNPLVIAGAGIAGAVWGYKQKNTDGDLNYLSELTTNLLQIATATLLTAPKIIGGVVRQKNIFSKTMLDNFIANGHRTNEIDNGNMKANITEVALTINVLMMRLMFKAMMSDKDEDEDNSLLNLAINMCGRTLNDITLMYNPVAVYEGLVSTPAVIRMVKNLVKLGDAVSDALAGDDVYTTGINAGDSKVEKMLQKVIYPSIMRDGLGFGSDMKKINSFYGEYGFEDLIKTDQAKMEGVIKTARTKFKSEIATKMAATVTEDQINNLAGQLRQQNPEMDESTAKRKATRLIEESIKNQAESITNKVIPTLAKRKKYNPKVTIEEIENQIEAVKQSGQ